jgi:hypothetical protein
MRAIVINAQERTVSEVEIKGSLKSLQSVVGGLIAPVYEGLGSKHHAYVNDEGLLNNPQHFFMLKGGYQPLAGNGVILGTTDDGNEADCTLALDWVKERVAFMDVRAVREWLANEPDQQADTSAAKAAETEQSSQKYSRWTEEPSADQSPALSRDGGQGQKR